MKNILLSILLILSIFEFSLADQKKDNLEAAAALGLKICDTLQQHNNILNNLLNNVSKSLTKGSSSYIQIEKLKKDLKKVRKQIE